MDDENNSINQENTSLKVCQQLNWNAGRGEVGMMQHKQVGSSQIY
jgi:hypothetical protein